MNDIGNTIMGSFLFFLSFLSMGSTYDANKPAFGDVRLDDPKEYNNGMQGNAQIFFSDGTAPANWSYICNSEFDNSDATVFCRELGYENGIHEPSSVKTTAMSTPMWLTNLQCSDHPDYAHILHCKHDLMKSGTSCSIARVSCNTPSLGFNKDYAGKVVLCPPNINYVSKPITTVSLGLVAIYLRSQWGGMRYDPDGQSLTKQVTQYHANMICQQMSFQKAIPGSVMTLKAAETAMLNFSYCTRNMDGNVKFENADLKLTLSWINAAKDLECGQDNKNSNLDFCLGCCFKFPSSSDSHSQYDESGPYFIVLQCMYNPFDEDAPYGRQSLCSFGENPNVGDRIEKYSSVCATKSKKDGDYIAAVTFLLIFLVISVILSVMLIVLCGKKCWKIIKEENSKKEKLCSCYKNIYRKLNKEEV